MVRPDKVVVDPPFLDAFADLDRGHCYVYYRLGPPSKESAFGADITYCKIGDRQLTGDANGRARLSSSNLSSFYRLPNYLELPIRSPMK